MSNAHDDLSKQSMKAMKAQTSMAFCAVLLLMGAPLRPASAASLPIAPDSPVIDHLLNVARTFVSAKGLNEKQSQAFETLSTAMRPCLAEALVGVDLDRFELTLEYYDKIGVCMRRQASGGRRSDLTECVSGLPDVGVSDFKTVGDVLDKCRPYKVLKDKL